MKRTLSIILSLAMIVGLLICFTGCSSAAGKYEFYKMVNDGESMTAADLEDMGMDPDEIYLELDKDGTGVLGFMGEEMDMEWEDDKIWPEGEKDEAVEFSIDDGKLTMEQDGMEMVFKKK